MPHESIHLADEEYGTGHGKQQEPVLEGESLHPEHLAEDIGDEHLAQEDDEEDGDEARAVVLTDGGRSATHLTQVLQQASSRLEIPGVEYVPELQQDEGCEEDTQFVRVAHMGGLREVREVSQVKVLQQVMDMGVVAVAEHLP